MISEASDNLVLPVEPARRWAFCHQTIEQMAAERRKPREIGRATLVEAEHRVFNDRLWAERDYQERLWAERNKHAGLFRRIWRAIRNH